MISTRRDDELRSNLRPEQGRSDDTLDRVENAVREIQAGRDVDFHFQRLFAEYEPRCRWLFTRYGFAEQADDLTQEVMVRVYKGIGKFRFDASFDTWMIHIMHNVRKNAVRTANTGKAKITAASLDALTDRSAEGGSAISEPADEEPSPLGATLFEEQKAELLSLMGSLPERMRECMELRREGFRYTEIAAALGVAEGTVKKQITEGRRRLRPLLGSLTGIFGALFIFLWLQPWVIQP